MLNWFKSLFSKKTVSVDSVRKYDTYKPEDRLIYAYWDGQKEVKADPLTLYKKVMEHGPEMSVDLKVSASPSKDAAIRHNALVKKIRDIFHILPLDQGGLSEMETIGLLDHFLSYCAIIKKNSPRSVMSSSPSVASTNSSPENQPTLNSSDSGSTSNESTTVEPEPSPTEQESPSVESSHP